MSLLIRVFLFILIFGTIPIWLIGIFLMFLITFKIFVLFLILFLITMIVGQAHSIARKMSEAADKK